MALACFEALKVLVVRADDLCGVADVPRLALLVVVPAVDALAQPIVEPAEVPAALAVHPAEVLDLVGPHGRLVVLELQPATLEAAMDVPVRPWIMMFSTPSELSFSLSSDTTAASEMNMSSLKRPSRPSTPPPVSVDGPTSSGAPRSDRKVEGPLEV